MSDGRLWASRPPDGPAPGLRYANGVERAAATIADWLVVALVAGIPYVALNADHPDAPAVNRTLGTLVVLAVYWVVYGVTAAVWDGRTFGGRLLGLRIVRQKDGGPIGWGRALVRPVGVLLATVFWFITIVAVVVGREKRTIADGIAGTVVIKRVAGARARADLAAS